MADRADAFVALPGGFGTLEEIAEQFSWMMLARHAKPIILLDIAFFLAAALRAVRTYIAERICRRRLAGSRAARRLSQ
jgi:predicted Rossmann-fold nucleotide-binding protein